MNFNLNNLKKKLIFSVGHKFILQIRLIVFDVMLTFLYNEKHLLSSDK